jgi:hypothetical protein
VFSSILKIRKSPHWDLTLNRRIEYGIRLDTRDICTEIGNNDIIRDGEARRPEIPHLTTGLASLSFEKQIPSFYVFPRCVSGCSIGRKTISDGYCKTSPYKALSPYIAHYILLANPEVKICKMQWYPYLYIWILGFNQVFYLKILDKCATCQVVFN